MTDWNTHALRPLQGDGRKLFIETYGCQMNVSDTEVVVAVMQREGYVYTDRIDEADVVLLNTCSIRDLGAARRAARSQAPPPGTHCGGDRLHGRAAPRTIDRGR